MHEIPEIRGENVVLLIPGPAPLISGNPSASATEQRCEHVHLSTPETLYMYMQVL